MKPEDLTGWRAFIAVATYGNFAKASREVGVPVSILSKRVAKLEEQLGARLFQRSTRVVSVTDEGRSVLPKIESLLNELTEVENSFKDVAELSGVVRVTCVPFIAQKLMIPIIKEFSALNPKVKLDLSLSEKIVNIIESGFDIAIRIETPRDSDLIYRKLAPNDLVFCASPKYLKKNKAPQTPDDLMRHRLLLLKIHEACHFKGGNLQLKRFTSRKALECDNGAFLADLALSDFGILVRSIWDVRKHFQEGSLVQVLKNHPLETFGHIHAVIPSKKFLAPRARAFYEFVLERSKRW